MKLKYIVAILISLVLIVVTVRIFPYVMLFTVDTIENLKARVNAADKQHKVLKYVSEHDNKTFDHNHASKELQMSPIQIYKTLLMLEKNGQIKAFPSNKVQKPILISVSDYAKYYNKVQLIKQ